MQIDEFLRDNPLTIVDIGASGGIDTRWVRFTSRYRGILFEPDPREFERLAASAADHLIVLNAALSDRACNVEFNLCRKQETSSVFRPYREFLQRFHNAERFDITRTITIAADTLDSQLDRHGIADIDFIKIDTQGYELPIFRGAGRSLERAIGVQAEVSFAPIYHAQPHFCELDAYMRERGFELFDLMKQRWRRNGDRRSRGQLVFADALYFKVPETLVALPDLDMRKVSRAIALYLAYGQSDIARELLRVSATVLPCDASASSAAKSVITATERRAALYDLLNLRRLRHGVAKWFARRQPRRRYP